MYQEQGYPQIIQSDNGKEFCGRLDRFCKKHSIRRIRSRPYNPQAQGKIERMHRTLKNMYQYDLLNNADGVNWVKMLPKYACLINTRPKQALGWHTPYQIFFGRKMGSFQARSLQNVVTVTGALHRKIRKTTATYSAKYIQKQLVQGKTAIFQIGDKVLYKYSNKPSGVPISHKIVSAKVIKTNTRHSTYKISYTTPKQSSLK
jgi:hypothetical protein